MVTDCFLPLPSSSVPLEGALRVVEPIRFLLATHDPRVARAAKRCTPHHKVVMHGGAPSDGAGTPIRVCVSNEACADESYSLTVREDGVVIRAGGAIGAFYGLQTLHQLSVREGHLWKCRRVNDRPDLPLRGLSLDVSRGRIPTMDRLFGIVDRLAAVKMNHLQLYVEHAFDFQFDPEISRDSSPLTAEEIRVLDAYCHERFIQLVPSLATFGHMGRILSLPRYARLAEVPATQDWLTQPWPTRIRGLTLDVRNPDALRLIDRLLDEFLPLFSSTQVNVNADETHDLGRGRNADYCRRVGRGRMYVDHLNHLIAAAARRGKRALFWGDVIRHHADLLPELDGDAVLLDWGYEVDSEFPAVRSNSRCGRDVIVCPGTSGWNRVLNGLNNADANITRAARVAVEHGAAGLLVTDWGDDGHFNHLACSMPAVLRAAALAWNSKSPATDVDSAIESLLFGPDSAGCLDAIRDAGRPGDRHPTWRLLYQPWSCDAWTGIHTSFRRGSMTDAVERARSIVSGALVVDAADRSEWDAALDAALLFAEAADLSAPTASGTPGTIAPMVAFRSHARRFAELYAAVWNAHNRPQRLHEVIAKLNDLTDPGRTPPCLPPAN